VSAEAAPHHLLLTHEACEGYNTAAKMNPPLREARDVEALRTGVADGTITVLATDHAPHTAEEKALPFEEAPFGIVGLETALALYAEALITTRLTDWPRLIALMTIEPARLCGLEAQGLGMLKPGGPADLTVIDPDAAWTIRASEFAGRSRNTPFEGRRVRGRAVLTIGAGRIVWDVAAGR
jgi:dihydroorotase